MAPGKPPVEARARQARAALERQLLARPEVRLIDIGFETMAGANPPGRRIVLRVHLAAGTDRAQLPIPEEVEGIPVRILTGDYRPA
jgi:hypothetical protein